MSEKQVRDEMRNVDNAAGAGLGQVAAAFIKLGFTAFGGPAAAYAMMRQEFVVRKRWLTEDEFLDFLGIANIVPGPNATELAILIGFKQGGWAGMIVAGAAYILPAMVIVLGLAWGYVRFGALPELTGILNGVKPVVIAILLAALAGMLKPRLKQPAGLVLVGAVFIAYLGGISPLILLIAGAVLMALIRHFQSSESGWFSLLLLPFFADPLKVLAERAAFSIWRLFWLFLKAGALMYGSGYVLLAFIHDDLVVRMGWLTESQLVDAIAVGQVTPGPLSTTATFVGYLLGGVPAALLGTLAMFLPSFIFVGIVYFAVNKLRESRLVRALLDGVNFAALGLMAGVTWEIGRAALVDPLAVLIAVLAVILIWRFKVDPPWLVLCGALVGLARVMLG